MRREITLGFAAYLVLCLGFVAFIYQDALVTALKEDRAAGKVRLSEASSRFKAQIDVFRTLTNTIAGDPRMAAFVAQPRAVSAMEHLLTGMALTYGALGIDLINRDGAVIASSQPEVIDRAHASGLVQAAMNGRLGYALHVENGQRLARFSRRIRSENRAPAGGVVVSAAISSLEFEWPVTPEPVIFFDQNGRSISANRTDLLLLSESSDATERAFPLSDAGRVRLQPLFKHVQPNGTISEVQVLTTDIPQLRMSGKILLDTEGARDTAFLRAGLAAALLVALGLAAAIFVQQKRRLSLESRHSATLEQRVEARTAQLRAAQDELVEASNLAALGRLSAGISHELNQPLGAILNFARNGRRLIERGRSEDAGENLRQIGEQIERISRIIGNLRAFARQEHAPLERIDLRQVVTRGLTMMESEIQMRGVDLQKSIPAEPVFVRAGKVRMEQVVVNLVTNALDAMDEVVERKLAVSLERAGEGARLTVRDTGIGIRDPERVFEPFYTTKQLGSSNGLGMGLALSFGLVSHFGGQLSCRNLECGAEFEILLPIEEEA